MKVTLTTFDGEQKECVKRKKAVEVILKHLATGGSVTKGKGKRVMVLIPAEANS